jgi:hypothetical protein
MYAICTVDVFVAITSTMPVDFVVTFGGRFFVAKQMRARGSILLLAHGGKSAT